MKEEHIHLKSQKSKYFISLISSILFGVLSIKLMVISSSYILLLAVLFFSLASAASFIPMLPNQSFLRIEKPGLTIRSMFKTIYIAWHEVEQFYIEKRNNKEIVVFSFFEKKKTYLNVENLIGKKEVLPDNYGMNVRELTDLLEYYRIRYSY